MNLTHDAVITEIPNFMNLGLSSVHTLDELGSVFITTTRIVRLTDGSKWILPGHIIDEVTSDRVSRMRPEKSIIPKFILKLGEEEWQIKILGAKIFL